MERDGAERAVAESDEQKLDEAWEALTWWRRLHARPLSTVAANLRYHVERGDARVTGRIEVAQRLKRLDTLIGKLGRERGNVTQMQDIGGVRAVLPSLRQRQVGLDLKFGAGNEHLDGIFVAMAGLIAGFDRAELSPDELRKGLRSLPSLTIRTPPPT